MAQDWDIPAGFGAAPQQPYSTEMSAAYQLRPLSTGEVLDRTFSVFRSHFWLFTALASISGGFSLVLNAAQVLVQHYLLLHGGLGNAILEAQASSFVVIALLLPVESLVYAASVYALCEVYLGREVTAGEALRSGMRHLGRYIGIALWQGWSAVWVFAILGVPAIVIIALGASRGGVAAVAVAGVLLFLSIIGGGIYGAIAYIRNSLAIPAALMEQIGVRASMRRSKTLAAGTKGRIFVVLLIAIALYMVVLMVESPMLFIIAKSPLQEHLLAQSAILLVTFLAHTLISPVALIGLTLVYFDQRVRNEAFDILMMMGPGEPATDRYQVSYPMAPPATVEPSVTSDHEPQQEPAPVVGTEYEQVATTAETPVEEEPAIRTDNEILP
jgi:hypothetical protein